MSDQQTQKSRKAILITICIAIIVIAAGFLYSIFSISTNLPQSKDTYNKFDHFRFQPSYNFLDSSDNRDLGQLPAPFLIMNYYKMVNSNYEKIQQETYKDKIGKMIGVITVSSSDDAIVYLSITNSEHIQVDPINFQKWNSILEYDSFDIDSNGIPNDVFKLDLKDARDYYQLKEKEQEFSEVMIMIPVIVKPIIGI